MRFYKRAKLFPGVYLSFSKSGISTTIGAPGASINFGKNGTFLNTGIPGTGFHTRSKLDEVVPQSSSHPRPVPKPSSAYNNSGNEGVIQTNNAEATTTEGLYELKKLLLDCYTEKNELKTELIKTKVGLSISNMLLVISYILIIGFFVKWFKDNRNNKREYLNDLDRQLENCTIGIDIEVDIEIEGYFERLIESYQSLLTCDKIWDITSAIDVDRKASRSAAGVGVTRRSVKFRLGSMDIIRSKFNCLHFENANGGDLYVYPAFIVIVESNKKFGLIDIRELDFNFKAQRFVEEEKVPKDAKIIEHTWAKVNKNGTPDKRFKDNYQIPICRYGEFEFSSATGLNEAYSLSNYEKAEKFASTLIAYQKLFK